MIRAFECLAHVPGDGACHEQHVRVAWRRHETQAETLEIIKGIVQRMDLEFASVARAGINFPNREAAAQTPTPSTLKAGA